MSGTGAEAIERCSFCHEQAEETLALSQEAAEAALE